MYFFIEKKPIKKEELMHNKALSHKLFSKKRLVITGFGD
jgi:hypothetical protein